jgi:hypothetical protein
VLNAAVLVLNRSYLPIHVTSVRRAFSLLYQGLARAVNEQYETFDFESWRALSVTVHEDAIGTVGGLIRVPRVILLTAFDRVPKRHVRFSRLNIYARDRSICQYCGRRRPRSELNLDHVLPRSRGGRTPDDAGLRLIRKPFRPRWTPVLGVLGGRAGHPEWRPFLSIVDAAYWNAELVEH